MNRLIGREIVGEEQRGHTRGGDAEAVIDQPSKRHRASLGKGDPPAHLRYTRLAHLGCPRLPADIRHAPRDHPPGTAGPPVGRLNPNRSWTRDRLLTTVASAGVGSRPRGEATDTSNTAAAVAARLTRRRP